MLLKLKMYYWLNLDRNNASGQEGKNNLFKFIYVQKNL